MLYSFARVLMLITFKIFFRKIDLVDIQKLNPFKPAILIANHPASFLDAMVIAVFLKRDIHFYVRGDIFANPLVYKILTRLHMIPIFSREHGVSNLVNNKRTFNRGRKLLEQGKLLLVFPEGFSRHSKLLEPFKKGAARVALQTAFEGGRAADLSIQTIAINYSYHGLGANLFIRIGEGVSIAGYEKQYATFPAQAIANLTKEMFSVFQNNVIHVAKGERTETAETLIRFVYNEENVDKDVLFQRFVSVCKGIDQIEEKNYPGYQLHLHTYTHALNAHQISDHAICTKGNLRPSLFLKVILLIPFATLGWLFWKLPGTLSVWMANRTVTRIDFYTSVLSGILGVLGFFWWIFITTVAYQFFAWYGPCVLVFLPLYCYCYLEWKSMVDLIFQVKRYRQLQKSNPVLVDKMHEDRKQLFLY